MTVPDHRLGTGYALPDSTAATHQTQRQMRLAGGAIVTDNGTLASDDFSAGTKGWAIKGDGTAEFNNGTFRGDIVANSFATDVAPNERIVIESSDKDRIRFYSGDSAETQFGFVNLTVSPDHSTANRRAFAVFSAPKFAEASQAKVPALQLVGAAVDDSVRSQIFLEATTTDYLTISDSSALSSSSFGAHLRSDTASVLIDSPAGNISLYAAAGSVNVTGPIDVTAAATLHSSLNVSGAVTMNSTINVSSTASFGASMGVSGTVTAGNLHTPGLETNAPGTFMVGQSPDGTRWRLTVDNAGTVVTSLA